MYVNMALNNNDLYNTNTLQFWFFRDFEVCAHLLLFAPMQS